VKHAPRLPLPRIGQPLTSGEVVTSAWIAAAQNEQLGSNHVEEATSGVVMPGDVQIATSLCDDHSPAESSQEATPPLGQKEQNGSSSPVAGTSEDSKRHE
jgi:hypothetical protein